MLVCGGCGRCQLCGQAQAQAQAEPEIELRLGGRAPGLYVDGERVP